RGKFHHSDAQFNLPIYLQPEIAEFIDRIAREKKMDASHVVNSLLKKDMELNEHGQ
ncbi:MAG: hypothetical protein JRC99_09880, partial [Deltaproteobacteria bacterium]|nr:hypothetical protein [Deltaproteobacteria bacterium]